MSKHTSPGNPRVAVAYLRGSKDEQRLSPEAQRAGIETWAERAGICVAAWCVDQGVSSVSPVAERPALRAALAALRRHRAGVLVVAKRDRIARDVVLAAGVERAAASAGARVVSASGEGNGGSPRRRVHAHRDRRRRAVRARPDSRPYTRSSRGQARPRRALPRGQQEARWRPNP